MKNFSDFKKEIYNSNDKVMYRNFDNVLEQDSDEAVVKWVAEDIEHFVEDKNDDRRRISVGVYNHIESDTLFKVTTRINNDPCGNFNVMDFSMNVTTREERIEVFYT